MWAEYSTMLYIFVSLLQLYLEEFKIFFQELNFIEIFKMLQFKK